MKGATAMQYIVTRFFNDGKASAKLANKRYEERSNSNYDQYVESIGEGGDYESVEDWSEEMCLDLDDIADIIIYSGTGHWIDISAYV
jgi:hypothetical protein